MVKKSRRRAPGSIKRPTSGRRESLETPLSAAPCSTMIDQAGDAFFLHSVEQDGRACVLDVNPKTCELLGYTRAELLDMTIQDVSAAFHPPPCQRALGIRAGR